MGVMFLEFPMTAVLARLLTVFHWGLAVLLFAGMLIFAFDPAPIGQNFWNAAVLALLYFVSLFVADHTGEWLGDQFVAHPLITTVGLCWTDLVAAAITVMMAIGAIEFDSSKYFSGVFLGAGLIALIGVLPAVALVWMQRLFTWIARGSTR